MIPSIKSSFLTLCFCFLFSFTCWTKTTPAQAIDSILIERPLTYKSINDQLKFFQRDSTQVKDAILRFTKEKYFTAASYEYIKLGNIYRKHALHTKALEMHQEALIYAKKASNQEFEIFSLNMIGVDYRKMNAYESSIDFHAKALTIAEKINNHSNGILRSKEVSYNSIGNVYILLEQYKLAIESFKKASAIAAESGNRWSVSINNENIGKTYEKIGEYDEAIFYVEKALDIDTDLGNHFGRMICYNRLASIYLKKNNAQKAEEYIEMAIPIAKSVNSDFYNLLISINKGKLAFAYKNYEEAETIYLKSLEEAQEKDLKDLQTNLHRYLSILYEANDKPSEALMHYKKHQALETELTGLKKAQYINDLIIKYESVKKSEKIKNLSAENRISELKHERQENIWIIISVLAGLAVISIYLFYRQRQLKSERNILDLEQRLMRFQMNPHFIFNALNAIKLHVIQNEKKNAVYYLNKFSKLMRKILESSLSKQVPLTEELETVALYLQIENIRFNEQITSTIDIKTDYNLEEVPVPSLFLQPFVENSLWHGLLPKEEGEKVISISVLEQKNHLLLEVKDNGIGRKQAAIAKSKKELRKKSVGITITKELLANFYKKHRYDFSISYTDLLDATNNSEGTLVSIAIPKK
ncbi:tetratricopeptide repeat protein [Mesonia ostreae]|uniref:Tetratricopeptide repeat protein n=1 Tax=Mesonia ostreae TaxID=861110 RepID=A0ABU2KKP2_9FLAO|nr:tetratricopeptide repeat protein [Mesonia ostreae]MDT0295301.1 tetratricopeptide repeat protein [Mesonia ostreae]